MSNPFKTTGERILPFAAALCLLAWAPGTARAQTQTFTPEQFVTADYFAVLGRAPDSTGWLYYDHALNTGTARDSVTGTLLSSDEYTGSCGVHLTGTPIYTVSNGTPVILAGTTYGNGGSYPCSKPASNQDFVTLLYLDALRREPDLPGWYYWYSLLLPNGALSQASAVAAFIATGTEFWSDWGVSYPAYPLSASISGSAPQNVMINYSGTSSPSNISSGAVFIGTGNPATYGSALTGCSFEWWQNEGVEMWESGPNGWYYLGSGTLGNSGSIPGLYDCSLDLLHSSYNSSTGVLTLALTYLSGMPGQPSIWSYAYNVHSWPSLPYQSLLASVTLQTSPAGLSLTADTATCASAPCTYMWAPGSIHTIAAPSPQQLNGITYGFSSWSDGGGASHNITVPSTAATYTASFVPATDPESATSQNLTVTAYGMAPPVASAFSCGAGNCANHNSAITYAPPGTGGNAHFQMYGDSTTYVTGNDAWDSSISVSAKITQWPAWTTGWNGADLGSECSSPAIAYGTATADARVPCPPPQTNSYTILSGPTTFTLHGSHTVTNPLTNALPSADTYDTLSFVSTNKTSLTYSNIPVDQYSNIPGSSSPPTVSSADGVTAS